LPLPLPPGRGSSSDVLSAAIPAAGSAGGADSSESAAWIPLRLTDQEVEG